MLSLQSVTKCLLFLSPGDLIEDVGYKEWEIVGCSSPEKANAYNMSSTARCGGMRRNGLLAIGDCNTPHIFFCEKPATNTVPKNIMRLGDGERKHGIYDVSMFRK